jgi:hypothetical protein
VTKPTDAERLARNAVDGVVRTWGRDWRQMISRPVQEALVANAVLNIVLSWAEPERIPASKVQEIARAAHALAFPDQMRPSGTGRPE